MDDDEILKTVHSILGTSVQVVDCEKTSSVRQEEILLINGVAVTLEGHDGDAIKSALRNGQVPSVELLNQLLHKAGILRQPIQLETSLSVKSSMVTTEEVSVARGGQILDGHSSETKEDYVYSSSKKEIWEPINATSTTLESEKMAYTPKYRLAKQAEASQSTEGAVGGLADKFNSSCNLGKDGARSKRSTSINISNKILSENSGEGYDYYYNCSDNDRRVEDDGDDDDDDEDGELYLLNPQPTQFANKKQPTRTATTTLSNKYQKEDSLLSKASVASISGNESSLLSYDSGHDGVFHSPSQQTATSNIALAPLQHSTANNTDHSISSCYDFISSDEADFVSTTTNNSNFGKQCTTTFASRELAYADLLNQDISQVPKLSNNKHSNSPYVAKNQFSNCKSPSPSLSSHPNQQQNTRMENINSTSQIIPPTSVENGLVFRDGNLISGPLDALITHMVPSSHYYPTRSFIFSFLLCGRLFIRPHELLARISATWEYKEQLHAYTMPISVDIVDVKSTQSKSNSSAGRIEETYPPKFADEESHQNAMKSAQNCIQLLSEWIDTFPYDFRDERLMQHVRVLARKCVYIDNSLGKSVSNILQNLVQRLTVLEKYEEFLTTLNAEENNESIATAEDASTRQKPFSSSMLSGCYTNSGYVHAGGSTSSNERDDINATSLLECSTGAASSYFNVSGTCYQRVINSQQSDSSLISVKNLDAGGIGISGFMTSAGNGVEVRGIYGLCPNAALLAHQLTHIELERLSHIGPEEFVQAFAKENHLESFSDMKKTKNLESYVQWFNRLIYFTATEIVKNHKKKQRVRIIEFWIETARECFNIGNFNSLMAIMLGLNLSSISRLKKTWSKIQSPKFSVLEHQMDPSSNFNSYRSTLKAAMWRSEGATNERERIIIPFFSLLVKDLYFLNEGCSNKLPNGHINFEKCWQLAKQVTEFNTWKKVTCPFEKLPKITMFLQMSAVLNENTLSIASFECETPENNQEKETYKRLKSETKSAF